MSESLAIARETLLDRPGLTEGHLGQVMDRLLSRQVDAADIYFQYARLESWVLDDGIIKEGNTDEFFGATDTVNGDNSGPVTATWVFDITGGTDLVLSVDMGAMGDFESDDFFEWTYSIDGGPTMVAFASSVDEAGSQTYTLEGGTAFTLNDPMLVDGTILTNDLATFSTPISGTGTTLELTLEAVFNGGTEAVAFQNVIVGTGFDGHHAGIAERVVLHGLHFGRQVVIAGYRLLGAGRQHATEKQGRQQNADQSAQRLVDRVVVGLPVETALFRPCIGGGQAGCQRQQQPQTASLAR